MVCDGAKASCAAKIMAALEGGLMGYEMYKNGFQFFSGDGLVKKGVENTINNIARLGSKGMSETDREILRMMIE
jgi:L-cysteine desulfidase